MLKSLVDKNIKVYVHCERGHGRSPTLVAAYFILEGLSASEAIKKVRDKRRIHLKQSQI
jgi:protein-tyrosine phosphatase|tara:strand:+ start:352 stop:528 length:177 start_codon:yes stop_codon:yes gene_type:complete